jgi:hypothetical protein
MKRKSKKEEKEGKAMWERYTIGGEGKRRNKGREQGEGRDRKKSRGVTGESVTERRKGAIRMKKEEIYWEVRKSRKRRARKKRNETGGRKYKKLGKRK